MSNSSQPQVHTQAMPHCPHCRAPLTVLDLWVMESSGKVAHSECAQQARKQPRAA